MHLPISSRLLACAQYIRPGDVVADVGCDHGYLGIHLLTNGIAKKMIASDINEGPLQSARHNARKFGVQDKMSFHLCPGVRDVPQDFDVMVCAGMGADTMVSILEDAPWLKNDRYRLILQCQSKTPLLRRYLSENGWAIAKESVLRDGRFLYTVMEVIWAPEKPRLSVGQWYLPPALLTNAEPETAEYVFRVMDGLRLAVTHRNDPEKKQALEELEIIYPPDKELL
jgi:tRNA (adenine22-N1)-methyltransferase